MKIRVWTLVPLVLGVIVLVTAAWVLRHELHGYVVKMKAWVGDLGIWGLIVFVAAFVVLTCIMVPDTLLSIAAGAVFGFVGGVAIVAISAAIARAVQYVLAHRVLQQRVQRYVSTRPRLMQIERAVRQDQLRLQFLIRLTRRPITDRERQRWLWEVGGAAVLIHPESKLIGKTIRETEFRSTYGLHVVGVRHAQQPVVDFEDAKLRVSDSLFVGGP